MLWHIFKNGWEDKEFIAQRVYGMDEIRTEVDEVDAGRSRGRHRRSRAQMKRVAETFAKAEAVDLHLVHGRHPAHRRHRQRPRLSATCCWPPAMSAASATAPTSSAATATCRARPISASISRRCRSITAWSRAPGALGARLGRRLTTTSSVALRRSAGQGRPSGAQPQAEHGDCRASPRPAGSMRRWPIPDDRSTRRDNLKAMFVMGHGGNTVPRMPEAVKGLEKLELLVVADPHPTTFVSLGEPQERHLSAADLHAVRDARARARRPTVRCSGASRSSSRSSRSQGRLRDHLPACAEARLRRADVQEHRDGQSKSAPSRRPKIDPARDQPRRLVSTGYTGQSPERLKLHMEQPGQVRPGVRCAAPTGSPVEQRLSTACPGRAGARRRSSIPAPTSSTTPIARGQGRRRHLPRALRRRSTRRSSRTARCSKVRHLLAENGSYSQGLGDQGRLSRVHLWAC